MTDQLHLDSIPVEHSRDPLSSFEAADRHTRSGKRATNAKQVLAYVLANPGCTSGEIARGLANLTLSEVRRRLTDLKEAGELHNPPDHTGKPHRRHCAATPSSRVRMLTWWGVKA